MTVTPADAYVSCTQPPDVKMIRTFTSSREDHHMAKIPITELCEGDVIFVAGAERTITSIRHGYASLGEPYLELPYRDDVDVELVATAEQWAARPWAAVHPTPGGTR